MKFVMVSGKCTDMSYMKCGLEMFDYCCGLGLCLTCNVYSFFFFFWCGAATQRGSWSPHS